MKTIRNIALILFVSGVFAVVNFLKNPNVPDLSLKPDEITLSQITRLPKNLIIVDARSQKNFKKGHIENAVNLSEESLTCSSANFSMYGHRRRQSWFIAISDNAIQAGLLPTD